METIEKIAHSLKKELKKKRYYHTLGVRYTAQAMAMAHGENIEKAGYAGILHDCAKNLSDEQMLSECKKYKVKYTEFEENHAYLLHAKLGAVYAKEIYGVSDENILSAIRWHTTGKKDMTELEKIIYIADYIEPARKELPGMESIRKMAFVDLDETMYMILNSTVEYLKKDGDKEHIEEHTLEALQYYSKLHCEK